MELYLCAFIRIGDMVLIKKKVKGKVKHSQYRPRQALRITAG
jgi:hypothetical protein